VATTLNAFIVLFAFQHFACDSFGLAPHMYPCERQCATYSITSCLQLYIVPIVLLPMLLSSAVTHPKMPRNSHCVDDVSHGTQYVGAIPFWISVNFIHPVVTDMYHPDEPCPSFSDLYKAATATGLYCRAV
jgi:hypothetical protein